MPRKVDDDTTIHPAGVTQTTPEPGPDTKSTPVSTVDEAVEACESAGSGLSEAATAISDGDYEYAIQELRSALGEAQAALVFCQEEGEDEEEEEEEEEEPGA